MVYCSYYFERTDRMLALYPKLIKRYSLLGVLLVVCIIAYLVLRPEAGKAAWIILGLIGLFGLFVAAGNAAMREHNEELNRLYEQLDAEGFVKNYEKHLTQKMFHPQTALMVRMHLSNAYVALGRFEEAERLLLEYKPWKEKTEEAGLLSKFAVVSNLCYCAEQREDLAKTEEYLSQLLEMKKRLEELQLAKPEQKRMVFSTELNEQCCKLLQEGHADTDVLIRVSKQNSRQMLPRVTSALWVARSFLADNQRKEAEQRLEQIVKLAPHLYPGIQARKILYSLPGREDTGK